MRNTAIAIAAVATVLGAGVIWMIMQNGDDRERQFDGMLWKSGDSALRSAMVRDLVGFGKIQHGAFLPASVTSFREMTQKDVLDKLGPADYSDETTMHYNLGYFRGEGFMVDPSTLIINFDDDGVVHEVAISS